MRVGKKAIIAESETTEPNNIRQRDRVGMQQSEIITFVCLLLFLLLPSLMGVVMAQDLITLGQRCIYLITALAMYGLGLCLFRRRTFFYVASLSFLFSAIEIIHLIMNHATTSLLFVFTVIKSEKGEFLELCSTYWFIALIFFALWGVYFYLNHRFIQQEYIAPRKWRMAALGVIAAFFVTDIVCLKLRPKFRNEFSVRNIDLRTAAWVGSEKVCPVNMLLAGYHLCSMSTSRTRRWRISVSAYRAWTTATPPWWSSSSARHRDTTTGRSTAIRARHRLVWQPVADRLSRSTVAIRLPTSPRSRCRLCSRVPHRKTRDCISKKNP